MCDYNFEKEQFMEEYYEMNKKSRSKAYSMWGWPGLFGGHRCKFQVQVSHLVSKNFMIVLSLI